MEVRGLRLEKFRGTRTDAD